MGPVSFEAAFGRGGGLLMFAYLDCLSLHEMNVERANTQTDSIDNWPLQNAHCGLTVLGRHLFFLAFAILNLQFSFFNVQSGGRQLQLQAKQSKY